LSGGHQLLLILLLVMPLLLHVLRPPGKYRKKCGEGAAAWLAAMKKVSLKNALNVVPGFFTCE
jgi:hypothetical protein